MYKALARFLVLAPVPREVIPREVAMYYQCCATTPSTKKDRKNSCSTYGGAHLIFLCRFFVRPTLRQRKPNWLSYFFCIHYLFLSMKHIWTDFYRKRKCWKWAKALSRCHPITPSNSWDRHRRCCHPTAVSALPPFPLKPITPPVPTRQFIQPLGAIHPVNRLCNRDKFLAFHRPSPWPR